MYWLLFWRPPCLLRRVIVNFTHDPTEALEGVLWSSRGPYVVLKDVVAYKAGAAPAKMPPGHDSVIHRSKIAFLQVLP